MIVTFSKITEHSHKSISKIISLVHVVLLHSFSHATILDFPSLHYAHRDECSEKAQPASINRSEYPDFWSRYIALLAVDNSY